jgi:hypothetical protein
MDSRNLTRTNGLTLKAVLNQLRFRLISNYFKMNVDGRRSSACETETGDERKEEEEEAIIIIVVLRVVFLLLFL